MIYALMFLLWSGFVTYGFIEGLLPRAAALAALIVIGILAGDSLRLLSWRDVLPYSVCWALMTAALDAVFSVPLAGWSMFFDWSVWLGYSLVALAPLLAPLVRARFFRPTA